MSFDLSSGSCSCFLPIYVPFSCHLHYAFYLEHWLISRFNLYLLDSIEKDDEEEHDLNSFMYQTVGHNVIPLYERALGIPLYRQPIVGSAIHTGTSYSHLHASSTGDSQPGFSDLVPPESKMEDETESLVPLLKRIMAAHPAANALCTGAILSTYQRTRIESVALRLGLTPLSYLWKYPILPPGSQTSLLQDMQDVGLDARIIKVASGGLDESFLWSNVTSALVIQRLEKAMKRFGTYGDGAVLGEGGEFETLVIDGPSSLFKGRIEIHEKDRQVMREGGGSAWLRILEATVVMKDPAESAGVGCRMPKLLEERFKSIINTPDEESKSADASAGSASFNNLNFPDLSSLRVEAVYWVVSLKGAHKQQCTFIIDIIQTPFTGSRLLRHYTMSYTLKRCPSLINHKILDLDIRTNLNIPQLRYLTRQHKL
jgi:uncharacterized protein (TIGR00290 family)